MGLKSTLDTAIVNGIPPEPKETAITSTSAKNLGVCIENTNNVKMEDTMWQLIDQDLEDQSAVTIWRTLGKARMENAMNETVTMVELKPKTGRFHQLRRHLVSVASCIIFYYQLSSTEVGLRFNIIQAWTCKCSIIGDNAYDGAGRAKQLRENGMFLCSNRVTLEHPFYKTIPHAGDDLVHHSSNDGDRVSLTEDEDGTVLVNVEIELPQKFNDLMKGG